MQKQKASELGGGEKREGGSEWIVVGTMKTEKTKLDFVFNKNPKS